MLTKRSLNFPNVASPLFPLSPSIQLRLHHLFVSLLVYEFLTAMTLLNMHKTKCAKSVALSTVRMYI